MGATLVIRADADAQIGTGHLMRCLALAQAWQDAGGQPIFVMATELSALEARLQSEGMEVIHLAARPGSAEDAMQTADLARRMRAPWVVADGYHFGADYQRIVKDAGLSLLFVDDNGHAEHYYADIVLNQNLHAREDFYANREPYAQLLLGTQYVLLRREFLKWQGWEREILDVAQKVLVTLGGSDPDNMTLQVIQALQQVNVDDLEAVVVVGGSNPHQEELRSAARHSRVPIRIKSNVTDMPELMTWAGLSVSGAGTTTWEIAFMGLPNLSLAMADNQSPIADSVGQMEIALDLGWHSRVGLDDIAEALTALSVDFERRLHMSQRAQALVNGEGVTRVIKSLNRRKKAGPEP